MDSQLEVFFEKIKLEMEKQTITLTNTLMTTLESKLKPILEENIQMKSEIEKLQKRVNYFENQKRTSNLVIYGLNEEEKSSLELLSTLKNIVHKELNIELFDQEITKIHRLGRAQGELPRPVLISFGNYWKRLEILKNKKKFRAISISEDFSKETLEKRKALKEKLDMERKKGNYAYIKGDTLIVKSNKNTDKRKRDNTVSPPHTKESGETKITPQSKFSKVDAFSLMRQRATPKLNKNNC
ncbi:unnamed protein product [Euphydryas editha]|uniref:Endonuclease-reverse transcriptase n=1 Tax=Euphydryas editha TaxID=104508 RepID=A0AAU9UB85_EUPED|nr:unnamed protein product [Euphydryas editha]